MNFFRRLGGRLRRLRPGRRQAEPAALQPTESGRARRLRERAENQQIRRRPDLGPLPNGRAMIASARARGRAFAKSGGIDPWLFSEEFDLPYLAELRELRDRAIAETRKRGIDLQRWDQAEHDHDQSQAAGLKLRREYVANDHGRALAHLSAAWARINWLARLEAVRHGTSDQPAIEDLTGDQADDRADAFPDESPAGQASAGAGAGTDPEAGDGLDIALAPPALIPTADADVWEGPHGARLRGRLKAAILGGLILVEVPIQFVIFKDFQGYGTLTDAILTWVFTLPTSAVMVLLPHLSGVLYRSRGATGTDRLLRYAPLLLLLPWAYVAGMLGYLRAGVLLAPSEVSSIDSSTGTTTIPSLAQNLHVTPVTMTVMFIALLIGIGGIGFLLGIAREHPLEGAYFGAAKTQRKLAEELSDVVPDAEQARLRAALGTRNSALTERQVAHRLGAIRATFTAAELSYLDAIANAAADPAVSEAIARLSTHLQASQAQPEEAAEQAGQADHAEQAEQVEQARL